MSAPFDFLDTPRLPPEDVAKLRDHVAALAGLHGLQWREEEMWILDAGATWFSSWFETPTVTSEFTYLVALHEIGHQVLGLPTTDNQGNVLFDNEVDVWKWALDEAIVDASYRAGQGIAMTLRSYVQEGQFPTAEQRQRLDAHLPAEGVEMRWRS